MSQLGKSNLNLNLNLNLGAANLAAANPAAHGATGVRINSQEFRKLRDPGEFPFTAQGAGAILADDGTLRIKYREFWDAELQAYVYLNEFLENHPKWLGPMKAKISDIERDLR